MELEQQSAIALQCFARDGFLCLPQILPLNEIQKWSERYASDAFFNEVFENLHQQGHSAFSAHSRRRPSSTLVTENTGHKGSENAAVAVEYAMGQGVRHGFREVVMRSPGRYEIAISDNHREDILAVLQNRLPFVPLLLRDAETTGLATTWKDIKIVNLSVVVSTPGAPEQAWHADGCHLNLHEHLPCHCLNIFVPLSVVTVETGPTELRPGTHYHTRNLAPFMLAAKAHQTLRPSVAPTMEPGDCLFFDYRILHRGQANRTRHERRTILVMAVAQPWFKDVVNFPSRSLYDTVQSQPDDITAPVEEDPIKSSNK